MKFKMTLSAILFVLLIGCSKNSDNNNSNNYSGSYKGNISTYINGALSQTLNNHTLVLVPTNISGQVTITNNVIITTSANVSGNTLTIPRAVAASSQSFDVVEYGTGTFNGTTLTIEFHQDQVQKSNNAVTGSGKWTGVLTKQ